MTFLFDRIARGPGRSVYGVRALVAAVLFLTPSVSAQQLPFEQVVAQLKSADAGAKLSALRLLKESGYPEAALPIAPLLSDPDLRIQREALATELSLMLGTQAPASRAFDANWGAMPVENVPLEVVTGLLTPLKDSRAATRIEAAYALGLLGQIDGVAPADGYRAVVEGLANRFGDPDPAVRVAAARAAGRVFRRCPGGCGTLAVERIGDGLVHLLNDPETAVQGAAMEGLGEIRYERAVNALTDVYRYYKSGEMAYGALDTLARIGHPGAIPVLKAALASPDPNFRRAAVEGLARTGDRDAAKAPDAVPASERDTTVILAVAFAQHRAGRAQHTARLLQALSNRETKTQAQDYLVELGPSAAAEVAAALPGASPDVRVALLDVLGITGGAEQLPAVEALKNERDARVASAAQRAASRMKNLGR